MKSFFRWCRRLNPIGRATAPIFSYDALEGLPNRATAPAYLEHASSQQTSACWILYAR